MTAHDHTTLIADCYRCELNFDELADGHAEILAEARRVIDTETDYDRGDLLSLLEEVVGIAESRVEAVSRIDVVYRPPLPQQYVQVRIVDSVDSPDPDCLGCEHVGRNCGRHR